MNRLIFKLIIVILCAVLLGIAIPLDAGYVVIKYNRFEYQSSFWISLAILGATAFTIWLCYVLIGLFFQLLGKVNPLSFERKQKLGELGLRELAEGNWANALKHLSKAVKTHQPSLSYYLGAAQAANELAEYSKSDTFIEQACNFAPKAKLSIGLTFARLLMARQDYARALSVTKELYDIKPNHPLVIQLLYTIYLQQENWAAIKNILPPLRKYKLLPDNTLVKLEQYVWISLLKESYTANKDQPVLAKEQLTTAWNSLPANAKEDYHLLEVYIQQLCSLGGYQEAEQVLQKHIDKNYSPELVYLYGQIEGNDNNQQIANAERWVDKHNNDAILFLTLGKLCQRSQLWGKAKEYFEKSIALQRSPEACLELAGYLGQRGEIQKSNQLFQESLQKFHLSLQTMRPE